MAEDRFANVFSAEVVQSAANTLTFAEMNFGITLRDRVAVVIDQLYWIPSNGSLILMTATGDMIQYALTVSDQVSDIQDLQDRRIMAFHNNFRFDAGTAANALLVQTPFVQEFSPPLIVLPNRMFIAVNSVGLASAATIRLRMHYRTVSITQDQQLIEVLESFQLST